EDRVTIGEQAIRQVTPDKSGSTGEQDAHRGSFLPARIATRRSPSFRLSCPPSRSGTREVQDAVRLGRGPAAEGPGACLAGGAPPTIDGHCSSYTREEILR